MIPFDTPTLSVVWSSPDGRYALVIYKNALGMWVYGPVVQVPGGYVRPTEQDLEHMTEIIRQEREPQRHLTLVPDES